MITLLAILGIVSLPAALITFVWVVYNCPHEGPAEENNR